MTSQTNVTLFRELSDAWTHSVWRADAKPLGVWGLDSETSRLVLLDPPLEPARPSRPKHGEPGRSARNDEGMARLRP